MGLSEREKGARGERELAEFFRRFSIPAYRQVQFGRGGGHNPDVRGPQGLHIECKRTERLRAYPAVQQALDDASEGQTALVCHKQNRREWLAILRLEDLLLLRYREGEEE